ncbi:MAG TPA: cohesin domain-containing protein, partial [Bacteroidia bacterium]|nr:cohesin domain-containing protein [Bacteroidia bacterium]
MKSDFFSSLFVVFAICVFLSVCPFSLYAEHPHACLLSGDEPAILSINQNDTIYFDFLHASCTSQHIEIPVYISTDDPVYALDFALKFNPSQFTFASFVNHKAYLNAATNFNPADSTLRFTSFSFTQVIESNSPLITLVFNYG